KQPAYIATVPRLGYRMVATVAPWAETSVRPAPRGATQLAAGACVILALALALYIYGIVGSTVQASGAPIVAQNSVAVLPFLDLTSESMDQEYFADGMTEELIDRLSKIPGLHVTSPPSSYYFKNKKTPVADIAKSLGVIYILDGSLRRAGATVRVAAR